MSEFEEWFAADTGCSPEGARRYAEKNPHMVKCWNAGQLSGRAQGLREAERIAAKYVADYWDDSVGKEIAEAILAAASSPSPKETVCEWKANKAGCGGWQQYKFCPYCGRPITIKEG